MSTEDESPLHSFLSERLPQLGLDYETYGPYVTGTDAGEDEDDNDELDGVLELLQSSSETHSDDDDAWSKFREELMRKLSGIRLDEEKRKEDELQRARNAEGEKAKQARMEAQRHQEELDRASVEGQRVDEEKKKRIEALVSRYGYEEEDDGDDGGGTGGKNETAEGSDTPQSNKEAAELARKAHIQKVREESSKLKEGKKAAREATAKQKLERNQKKEERKKRAQKGERRR